MHQNQKKPVSQDTGNRMGDWLGADGPPASACCCPAIAVVQVILPPSPTRPHETDLLLCGHHYRQSAKALAAANAIVIELPTANPSAALLPKVSASA